MTRGPSGVDAMTFETTGFSGRIPSAVAGDATVDVGDVVVMEDDGLQYMMRESGVIAAFLFSVEPGGFPAETG